MKRVNNIYKNICELDNILEMAHMVCLNTNNKNKVENFNRYISENLFYIKNIVSSKSYNTEKYNIFLIREPKLRLIMSQSIKDKVVNHLCAKYFLVDIFDKSFIDSSVATRKGKGTHYGIKLLKRYLNKIKRNNDNFYILKFDIKKYFYNMDHEIIKELIRKRIKDKDAIAILDKIIDSTDEDYINIEIDKIKTNEIKKIKLKNISQNEKDRLIREIEEIPLYKKGKGFPIGNMTSQIFANIYLNELDHFIKEVLKIKYYIRYMDDGVLIHRDINYLKYCLKEIIKVLNRYKLDINYKKTCINSIKDGIDFLGFRFYIKNNKILMKVRNSTKKRFIIKSKTLNKIYKKENISKKVYVDALASYRGHLKWGNCKGLYFRYVLFKN